MSNALLGFIQATGIRAKARTTPRRLPVNGGARSLRRLAEPHRRGALLTTGRWLPLEAMANESLGLPSLLKAPGQEALLYLFDTETAGRRTRTAAPSRGNQAELLPLLDQKQLPDSLPATAPSGSPPWSLRGTV